MTISEVASHSALPPTRAARTRHYAMTAPTHFAVEYAINPWMDTSTPGGRRTRMATVGEPAAHLSGPRPLRRSGGTRTGLARYGLRRQRRAARRWPRHRRPLRLSATGRRGRCLRRMDEQPGGTSARADPPHQRGPGRPPGRRIEDPGGTRFSHRPAGTRRDRRHHRTPGGRPGTGGSPASTIWIPH